jgi:hypothetical protein
MNLKTLVQKEIKARKLENYWSLKKLAVGHPNTSEVVAEIIIAGLCSYN